MPSSPEPAPSRNRRALAAFAALTLGFMVLVILWGAIVRATGSGAGCGDNWPRCNGVWLPRHPVITTIIEFTHRSMSGICTALVAALIAWTFLATPRGHRARRAVVWSGILLITEALLGALLVLGGFVGRNTSDLRTLVQCIHFTNTMLLLAALTITWRWLRSFRNNTVISTEASTLQSPNAVISTEAGQLYRPAQRRDPQLAQPAKNSPRPTHTLTIWALAFTILTGATGSVAALADTLFPSPSLRAGFAADFAPHAPLLLHMRWVHPASALLSLACVVVLGLRLRGPERRWLISLATIQLALGLVDLALLAPIVMQQLHLLGADLYWIALVSVSAEILWPNPKLS